MTASVRLHLTRTSQRARIALQSLLGAPDYNSLTHSGSLFKVYMQRSKHRQKRRLNESALLSGTQPRLQSWGSSSLGYLLAKGTLA